MSGPRNDLDEKFKDWTMRKGSVLRSAGQLTDCTFQVGAEENSTTFPAHKLVVAAASPVFEAMFYGKMAESNQCIRIPDIQPDVFEALLGFIYTGAVSFRDVDFACGLYYGAHKYMLPDLVEKCSNYIRQKIDFINVCRVYEFGLIFEDQQLISGSKHLFTNYTTDVLHNIKPEHIEANTLLTILSLEKMTASELTLFSLVEKYAKKQQIKLLHRKIRNNVDENLQEFVNTSTIDVKAVKEFNGVGDSGTTVNTITNKPCTDANQDKPIAGSPGAELQQYLDAKHNLDKTIRKALKKIRFLTMTAEQFIINVATSPLLTESEALAVLMNINTTEAPTPMPKGFSMIRQKRNNK